MRQFLPALLLACVFAAPVHADDATPPPKPAKHKHARPSRHVEKQQTASNREEERRILFCKQHPDQCPNRHDDEEQFHPHTISQSTETEKRSGPPR